MYQKVKYILFLCLHVIAISLFIFSTNIIHYCINTEHTLIFFGEKVHRNFFFDLSLILIGISFFIELMLAFILHYNLITRNE